MPLKMLTVSSRKKFGVEHPYIPFRLDIYSSNFLPVFGRYVLFANTTRKLLLFSARRYHIKRYRIGSASRQIYIAKESWTASSASIHGCSGLRGHTAVAEYRRNASRQQLTYTVNFSFSRDDPPAGFTNFVSAVKIEGPASVGPKETLSFGAFRDKDSRVTIFPRGCLDDFQRGKFRYSYVWGAAVYKDVFKPERNRETRFCWRLYGTLELKGEIAFNHFLCDERNCQDEDCKLQDQRPAPEALPADTCLQVIPPNLEPTPPELETNPTTAPNH